MTIDMTDWVRAHEAYLDGEHRLMLVGFLPILAVIVLPLLIAYVSHFVSKRIADFLMVDLMTLMVVALGCVLFATIFIGSMKTSGDIERRMGTVESFTTAVEQRTGDVTHLRCRWEPKPKSKAYTYTECTYELALDGTHAEWVRDGEHVTGFIVADGPWVTLAPDAEDAG